MKIGYIITFILIAGFGIAIAIKELLLE